MMDVENNKVCIQPTVKPRQQLHMLQKQSHAVCTAVGSIYDYDDDIYNDSSSHARETDTEDEKAECDRYYDRSVAHIQSCMYCLHESQLGISNAAQVTLDVETIFPE